MNVASRLSFFLAELKRRKVYNVAAVYAAVGAAVSLAVPDLFGAVVEHGAAGAVDDDLRNLAHVTDGLHEEGVAMVAHHEIGEEPDGEKERGGEGQAHLELEGAGERHLPRMVLAFGHGAPLRPVLSARGPGAGPAASRGKGELHRGRRHRLGGP